MDEENIYYYALHNELNLLLDNIKQTLSDAIAGSNSNIKSAEEFKTLKEGLIKQDKMSGILFATYHNISNSFYSLSSEIKGLLDELDKYIDEIELPRVESSINSDIMKINYYDKIRQLHEAETSLIQLAYECGLSSKELVINNNSEKITLSFEDTIKRMIELEKESLDIDRGIIELKSQNIIARDNTNINVFNNNNEELNTQANIKDKAIKIIELCNKIREQLQKELDENGLEFAKLQETVSMILAQNLEKVDNADKFFTSFVMDQYDNLAKEEEKKQEREKLKQEIIVEYDNLVQELNELKERLPEFTEELSRLEARLLSMNIDKLKGKIPAENLEVALSI